jgi:hypothetical protein
MNKSGSHNRKLACSAMFPKCAWVHYTAVFQSSVGYPLSMCHLSTHQLHDLQKKYIPTLLRKIGIIRTHAHALVFGPKSYGGIGCNDLRIGAFRVDPRTYFTKCNKMDRRWKIIIFLTHLFNARKASLASGVPSFCSNIRAHLARIVNETNVTQAYLAC